MEDNPLTLVQSILGIINSHHRNIMFHHLSLTRLKKLIMEYYCSNYD